MADENKQPVEGSEPKPPATTQIPPTPTEPPKEDPEKEVMKKELDELRKVKIAFDSENKRKEEATKTAQELLSTRDKELADARSAIEEQKARVELIKKGVSPDSLDDVWSLTKGDLGKVDEVLKKYPGMKTGYTPPAGQHQGAPGGGLVPPPKEDEYKPGSAWEKYPEPRRKY